MRSTQEPGTARVGDLDTAAARRPGRPLDPVREAAVLDATLELMMERGIEGLTVLAACRRAGASSKTAYRRWAGLDELLVAALHHAASTTLTRDDSDAVDTGTLRGDMLANITAAAQGAVRHPHLSTALMVLSQRDGELGDLARELRLHRAVLLCERIIGRAHARGEIGPDVDAALISDTGQALIDHQILIRRLPVDEAFARRIVDGVLLPMTGLRAP